MATLNDILPYTDLGWSLIPTRPGTKRPATKSVRRWATDPADRKTLWRWFRDGHNGVAVMLGDSSDGLCVRDFDAEDAYRDWKANHPSLAKTLPTSRTGRGRHVFFMADASDVEDVSSSGSRIVPYDDGELKAAGLAMLPPSQHESGRVLYRWQRPPFDGVPFVSELVGSGLAKYPASERPRPQSFTQENTGKHKEKECDTPARLGIVDTGIVDVDAAIAMTLPDGPGQRHRNLFDLARRLKAVPEYATAQAADLRDIVREWHTHAKPFTRTKDWLTTWGEFQNAWRRVRYPAGSYIMGEVVMRARIAGCPAEVAADCDGDPSGLAAAICRELAAIGDGMFWLDCRTLGRYIETSHTTAATILRGLQELGLIELKERGKRRRASEYRYLGCWSVRTESRDDAANGPTIRLLPTTMRRPCTPK